ncbi:MAG: hypothetical protein ACPGSO_07115 [Vicingaceae bacterium]
MIIILFGGALFLTSCAKGEECVCSNTATITEADAKDVGVSLEDACELAKIGDESCKIE